MTDLGVVLRSWLPVQLSVELAQEAERKGFHSVWVTETMDSKDAYTQMAAIAMKTQRIRVGSGITAIYTRTPVMAAMAMMAVAELSGERAIFGLGTGHAHGIEGGHGLKLGRPLTTMREYAEIVRLVTQKRDLSYRGEVYNIPHYVGTSRKYFEPRPFHIPIFIAGLRPKMRRLAGELADGVLMNLATPQFIRRGAETVREGALAAGRDPDTVTIASFVATSVSGDEDAGAQVVRLAVANFAARMPFYRRMLREHGYAREMDTIVAEAERRDVAAAAAKFPDEMVRSLGVFGPPQQARQALVPFEDTGADLLVLMPYLPRGVEPGQAIGDMISAFARTGSSTSPA